MILGSNQPYFLPYIGYFQLIHAVDLFEICDDFQYISHGWVNRNRVLTNGQAKYYNIDILHASTNKKINELFIAEYSKEKKMQQLQILYGRAPFFNETSKLMEQIYAYPKRNLASFLTNSIQTVCRYLEISTPIILSSQYEHDRALKKEYGIYDSCHRLKACTYYNAIGGMELYSFEDFRKQDIELGFLKTGEIQYKQFKNEFVPNLSILDVMMFNSAEQIREMLDNYTIVKE